jgi:hypothetical protein
MTFVTRVADEGVEVDVDADDPEPADEQAVADRARTANAPAIHHLKFPLSDIPKRYHPEVADHPRIRPNCESGRGRMTPETEERVRPKPDPLSTAPLGRSVLLTTGTAYFWY